MDGCGVVVRGAAPGAWVVMPAWVINIGIDGGHNIRPVLGRQDEWCSSQVVSACRHVTYLYHTFRISLQSTSSYPGYIIATAGTSCLLTTIVDDSRAILCIQASEA